ncbi:MAG: hypothetical protein ACNA8K_16755 [Cyclonatronaceae bacterium]
MMLSDIFVRMCENGLTLQLKNGSMPSGHNGPHNDPETPVRNTSHWLISFVKARELSGDDRFLKAAQSCLAYLTGPDARPGKGAFWHRSNPKKDFSNGIIGQAWTLEALIYAGRIMQDDTALRLAEDVFTRHPYDRSLQAWKMIDLEGNSTGIDRTFNHQLWFASIGCRLMEYGSGPVTDFTMDFVNSIHRNIGIYRDGVIKHYPYGYAQSRSMRRTIGRQVHHVKQLINPDRKAYSHSAGYHAFNTYALHTIRISCPGAPVFNGGIFEKALAVCQQDSFRHALDRASFGFPYNPPGTEIAVSLQSARRLTEAERKEQMQYWLNRQFERNFDSSTFRMTRNTPDPLTYEARIYELYQLDSFDFEIDIS